MSSKIRIGISQGDINGIGLEVILKTFNDPAMEDICTPVLFSSQKTISLHRKALGIDDLGFLAVNDLDVLNTKKPNLFQVYEDEVNIELGKQNQAHGKYAVMSLEKACTGVLEKKLDVLVTGPIDKHVVFSDSFPYKGHTEYLDKVFGAGKGEALMLMVADNLRVALVTGHIPLEKVHQILRKDLILAKLRTLNKTLLQDFGIRKPKIAVLGLNPHAGDQGTIGKEENDIIMPAINAAKAEGIMAIGPFPGDGFFGSGNYNNFDAVLAMYHDQGLIPFKALAFNNGVNYTAGLNFIRTSPDHGTGYEIAGKNMASEASFRKAVYLAIDIFRKRNEYALLTSNPLKSNPLRKE